MRTNINTKINILSLQLYYLLEKIIETTIDLSYLTVEKIKENIRGPLNIEDIIDKNDSFETIEMSYTRTYISKDNLGTIPLDHVNNQL